MEITNDTIDKLAHLARLEFNGADKESIKQNLTQITAFCEKLNEIDTTGVEPLIYMSTETNILRDDIIIEEITHAEALKNAPKNDSDYFRVPKFLEK